MPLKIQKRSDTVRALQAYANSELKELDPTVTRRRGVIGGLLKSIGSALHDWYVMLKKYADNEPFPQTATESFFEKGWWLDITGLERNPATAAQGFVVITGDDGAQLPADSEINFNGNTYKTDNSITVLNQGLVGKFETPEINIGRYITPEPHNLATGIECSFSGGQFTQLNITSEIRVIDSYTIEYDLEESISGQEMETNPLLTATWGNALITCTKTGIESNIDQGAELSISSPPEGIEATALITFGGVADGTDLEDLETWRQRVLESLGIDFGVFSAQEIIRVAKKVPGVTRVFVREPKRFAYDENNQQIFEGVGVDGYPTEGRVRISFLRENDADPIPSALEVEQVRKKIHGELVPAHTLLDDVEILAPERYSLEVRFLSISPDTPGMRASIRANLKQFLIENANWGGVLEIEDIRCAIRGSYDAETNQELKSYELDSPTMDIALPVDAYPVLAAINWRVTT